MDIFFPCRISLFIYLFSLPIMPVFHIILKILKALALFVLSVISLTALRATPLLPFIIPHKAREPMAHQIFLLSPNKQLETELPINPVSKTGLLPNRSEIFPQIIAVQNCAMKNTDAKKKCVILFYLIIFFFNLLIQPA